MYGIHNLVVTKVRRPHQQSASFIEPEAAATHPTQHVPHNIAGSVLDKPGICCILLIGF